jgi:molybdopterin/thiamine biosynthesis adenylyltransferase
VTTARQENARTLASAIGRTEEEADQLLDTTVLVTSTPASEPLTGYVATLLARTLTRVLREPDAVAAPAVEITMGGATPRTRAPVIGVGVDGFKVDVRDGTTMLGGNSPMIVELVAACYGAAAAVHRALGIELAVPLRLPIEFDLEQLYGPEITRLDQRIDLGTVFLAGAGAIGNAVICGLSALNVHGQMHLCDPDDASDGNLNRCWWFDQDDLAKPKAERLVFRAQSAMPTLRLIPHVATLNDAIKKSGVTAPDALIVAVDSRRARRSLQTEMPRRVFDASTTGITELVLHFNHIPSDSACMSCIYHEAPDDAAHEAHVADALGVDVSVVRANFVSAEAARAIARKYPGLDAAALEGLAYDSVFKELCGRGQLKTSTADRVLAPFAFVSVLAGVALAIEIAIRTAAPHARYNYWRISPWGRPLARMRELRPKRTGCEFCSNETLQSVVTSLWG